VLEFHSDKPRYFDFTYQTARDYIIPFIEEKVPLTPDRRVLEIGSAEAGVLKAFTERGHHCTGIELMAHRVELARKFMAEELNDGKVQFISRDIYDIDPDQDLPHKFHVIILKDVIEHIHDQAKFIPRLRHFLAPGGVIFFGFPPWQMPFGGHQQLCTSKFAGNLPWYHLFPMPLYMGILRLFGEKRNKREALAEIKETGISIERLERIAKDSGMQILSRRLWLFNPIYKYKFKLTPRRQARFVAGIPWIRNFWSTAAYYLVAPT
jgi:SAM-dependent methyltransferase